MLGEPSRSFELLGFDLLLDTDLKPWLIEVNYSPSLRMGSPLGIRSLAARFGAGVPLSARLMHVVDRFFDKA